MKEKEFVIHTVDELKENADKFKCTALSYQECYECARHIAEYSLMVNDGYAYISPHELLYQRYWMLAYCGNFDLSAFENFDGMCDVFDVLHDKIILIEECDVVYEIYERITKSIIEQYDPVRAFGNEVGRVFRFGMSNEANAEVEATEIAAEKLLDLVQSYRDLAETAAQKNTLLQFSKK